MRTLVPPACALSGAGGGLAAVGVRASVPSGAVATGIVAPLPERPVALRAVAPEAVHAPLARAVEAAGGSLSGAGFIAINRATIEELQVLPGIGPAKAAAIVRHRETHGAFTSLADLDAVAGIGPATIEKLGHYGCLGRSAVRA